MIILLARTCTYNQFLLNTERYSNDKGLTGLVSNKLREFTNQTKLRKV